jgi:hypothetical protein
MFFDIVLCGLFYWAWKLHKDQQRIQDNSISNRKALRDAKIRQLEFETGLNDNE